MNIITIPMLTNYFTVYNIIIKYMISIGSGEIPNRTEVVAFLVEAVFGYLLEYILIHKIFSDYTLGIHSKLPDREYCTCPDKCSLEGKGYLHIYVNF